MTIKKKASGIEAKARSIATTDKKANIKTNSQKPTITRTFTNAATRENRGRNHLKKRRNVAKNASNRIPSLPTEPLSRIGVRANLSNGEMRSNHNLNT